MVAIGGAFSFTGLALVSQLTSPISDLSLYVVLTIYAGVLGSWLGFLNGLLVAALSNRFFFPLKNAWLYRWIVGIFTPGLGLLVAMAVIFSHKWELIYMLPIGFALSMTIASQVVANWYIKESRKVRRLELDSMPNRNDP